MNITDITCDFTQMNVSIQPTPVIDNFGTRYSSIPDAARRSGIPAKTIRSQLNGNDKIFHGYFFSKI